MWRQIYHAYSWREQVEHYTAYIDMIQGWSNFCRMESWARTKFDNTEDH